MQRMAFGTSLLFGRITRWASQLRFPVLLTLVGFLFVVDLVVIDPIPLIDEILLALVAIVLTRWKDRRKVIDVEHVDIDS